MSHSPRTRRSRRRRPRTQPQQRPLVAPDAAGIDVGARQMYVAVPEDRDPEPVRIFSTFTEDREALADWLLACGITTAAMESSGVYWIPQYQILEDRGIKVCLTSARQMRNVPGRRTDWQECQWLQYLHSVGLLRAAFRPQQQVCATRSLMRHRGRLVESACDQIRLMQKSLTQMNVQRHHVISDLTGVTGMAIVDAILGGERDATRLARLRRPEVRATQETIRKSLEGDGSAEHLFTLKQARELYGAIRGAIEECDREIEGTLGEFEPRVDPDEQPPPPGRKKRKTRRAKRTGDFRFDTRREAYRLFGVDVTEIPGLGGNALTLFSEVGRDMNRWASADQFVSWLALCPDNDKTGGKVVWRGVRAVKNRAGQLFPMAANALHHSATPRGQFLRRMKARLGAPAGITATAHKIARIFYAIVRQQVEYDETIWRQQDTQRERREQNKLKRQAHKLGYQLVPIQAA